MKVAIAHYWLRKMRGGENVVEALCELFPEAVLFTHVYDPDEVSDTIRRHEVRTTFINKLPFSKRLYTRYLPLMPLALEQLDLGEFDLVISSESGPAKGVIPQPGATHICYCHTPMRYLWNMYHEYLRGSGLVTRMMMPYLSHKLRQWDISTNDRVDHFVANSENVANRIWRYYRRESQVVYPPVNVDDFVVSNQHEDFFLYVGDLADYKRVDLIVDACEKMNKKLVVLGSGGQYKQLKKLESDNIQLLGYQPNSVRDDYINRCQALLFPGEEDFGIVPVEAMACGKPVIALGKGGALETVIDKKTGLFFEEQTTESISAAIEEFSSIRSDFDRHEIRQHAEQFSKKVFKDSMRRLIDDKTKGQMQPPLKLAS
ncbi:MAG: glycosyltransferase [Gammaproteobacteria bacterium]|nr:glycosyltransferase [Gammaproteobacteria bacterium]